MVTHPMQIAWFAVFHDKARPTLRIADAERERLISIVRATPRLASGIVYSPAATNDPYLDDGASPQLALELLFANLPELEAVLAPDGHLQALAQPETLPSLAGASVTQQAMLVRSYAVPDPVYQSASGQRACAYLVDYPGPAADLNAWTTHYIGHHAPLMAKFPDIRRIEICTRLDWCGFLSWPRAHSMLRNIVCFDSPQALTAALNSPVRHAMREDFRTFPPFEGGNTHYPMTMELVTPR
jgi:hypothetical protein